MRTLVPHAGKLTFHVWNINLQIWSLAPLARNHEISASMHGIWSYKCGRVTSNMETGVSVMEFSIYAMELDPKHKNLASHVWNLRWNIIIQVSNLELQA